MEIPEKESILHTRLEDAAATLKRNNSIFKPLQAEGIGQITTLAILTIIRSMIGEEGTLPLRRTDMQESLLSIKERSCQPFSRDLEQQLTLLLLHHQCLKDHHNHLRQDPTSQHKIRCRTFQLLEVADLKTLINMSRSLLLDHLSLNRLQVKFIPLADLQALLLNSSHRILRALQRQASPTTSSQSPSRTTAPHHHPQSATKA
jgi:DNA primase